MIVNFKKCSVEILREMISSFYELDFDNKLTEDLNGKWSPAEVNQILFRNFKDIDSALNELLTLTPDTLYGFKLN
jgi:hypothetical protein